MVFPSKTKHYLTTNHHGSAEQVLNFLELLNAIDS